MGLIGESLSLPANQIRDATYFEAEPKVFAIRGWVCLVCKCVLANQAESSESGYFPNRKAKDKRYIPLQSQKG